MSRIITVSVRVVSLSLWHHLISYPYMYLGNDYSGYHKKTHPVIVKSIFLLGLRHSVIRLGMLISSIYYKRGENLTRGHWVEGNAYWKEYAKSNHYNKYKRLFIFVCGACIFQSNQKRELSSENHDMHHDTASYQSLRVAP